jgi:hypothetical protein
VPEVIIAGALTRWLEIRVQLYDLLNEAMRALEAGKGDLSTCAWPIAGAGRAACAGSRCGQ